MAAEGVRFKDYRVPGDLAGAGGDWRENFSDYLGCCASLDENLGRLRARSVVLDTRAGRG